MIDIDESFSYHQKALGAVAHLARAIEWHSIGSRFDPDQLHLTDSFNGVRFSFPTINTEGKRYNLNNVYLMGIRTNFRER